MSIFQYLSTKSLFVLAVLSSFCIRGISSTDQGDELPLYTNKTIAGPETNTYDSIVGGTQADLGEYPCYVQGQGCGGSLIWHDIILTAAHCDAEWLDKALLGAYEYDTAVHGAEYAKIETSVQHPSYDYTSQKYDFRIVVLKRLPKLEHKLCVINKEKSTPTAGSSVTAIGLGVTGEFSDDHPEYLAKVSLEVISTDNCNIDYKGRIDSETMICAANPNRDTCYGDSGGPVFDKNGIQVGITSWGFGCADKSHPGVYSNVAAGAHWIEKMVCQLSREPPSWCETSKKSQKDKHHSNLRKSM